MGTMRPRPVIAGRTYMFTRRCSERRFFLRPDPLVTNAFWFCLGWAADKHGMLLHAAVALSNHVHVVATDPRGVYPDFLRDFNGLLARVVNAARGRWEHFWDANQASAVLLEDEAAQLDKVVYTLTNPVGLVDKAADSPGLPPCTPSSGARPSPRNARSTSSGLRTPAAACQRLWNCPSRRLPR